MSKFYILLFLLSPSVIVAQQTLKGKVYDDVTTVKGARIYNETQNTIKFSNDEGNFSIEAEIGDRLILHSLFHNKLHITVEAVHFKNTFVFELTKFTNELDAVEIIKREDRKFDSIAVVTQTNNQIANDVKNRPYLYSAPSNGNMDFVAIAKLIGKLFKKKKSTPEISYAAADDFKKLFEKDQFFNPKMLSEELGIAKDHQFLFFEYCSAKNIHIKLISEQRNMELLELFLTYSKEFNILIEKNTKD